MEAFQMAHLAIIGSKFKTAIGEELHYECHQVAVWHHPQQHEVEPTEPHSIIYSSQVIKYNANFLHLKSYLDIISLKCHLLGGGATMRETGLML